MFRHIRCPAVGEALVGLSDSAESGATAEVLVGAEATSMVEVMADAVVILPEEDGNF